MRPNMGSAFHAPQRHPHCKLPELLAAVPRRANWALNMAGLAAVRCVCPRTLSRLPGKRSLMTLSRCPSDAGSRRLHGDVRSD